MKPLQGKLYNTEEESRKMAEDGRTSSADGSSELILQKMAIIQKQAIDSMQSPSKFH